MMHIAVETALLAVQIVSCEDDEKGPNTIGETWEGGGEAIETESDELLLTKMAYQYYQYLLEKMRF